MKIYTLFFCLLLTLYSFSQDSLKKWQSFIGVNFTTVPVAQNPGDTTYENVISIDPSFRLLHKSGIGFTYSPRLLTKGNLNGYLHEFSFGYEQYDRSKFDINAQISHFIFIKNNEIPFSPLNNELFVSVAYKRTLLKPVIITNIGSGKDSSGSSVFDVALASGISHDFEWDEKGLFSYINIASSLLINASTSKYFSFMSASNYISHNHDFQKYENGGKGKGKGGSSGGSGSSGSSGSGNGNSNNITTASNVSPSINFNNVELNVESIFEIGHIQIKPAGSVFMPINAVNKNLDTYWQIGVDYKF